MLDTEEGADLTPGVITMNQWTPQMNQQKWQGEKNLIQMTWTKRFQPFRSQIAPNIAGWWPLTMLGLRVSAPRPALTFLEMRRLGLKLARTASLLSPGMSDSCHRRRHDSVSTSGHWYIVMSDADTGWGSLAPGNIDTGKQKSSNDVKKSRVKRDQFPVWYLSLWLPEVPMPSGSSRLSWCARQTCRGFFAAPLLGLRAKSWPGPVTQPLSRLKTVSRNPCRTWWQQNDDWLAGEQTQGSIWGVGWSCLNQYQARTYQDFSNLVESKPLCMYVDQKYS